MKCGSWRKRNFVCLLVATATAAVGGDVVALCRQRCAIYFLGTSFRWIYGYTHENVAVAKLR